ncbi:EF-hand domain-containing protein [Methylophilus sp. 3sh_L]|uniref:EF-hand domain-containing protein n=1 Tax=Methylophilus sp. 3sh_L TaxID=3377114 RepID=UPI00398E9502
MASILCTVSAQITQNIFARIDLDQCGFLDQQALQRALNDLSQEQVRSLLNKLDQDGDERVSPYELNLAIIDWLSQSHLQAKLTPVSPFFTRLVCDYGPTH